MAGRYSDTLERHGPDRAAPVDTTVDTTDDAPAAGTVGSARAPRAGVRVEIQALRAIAVSLVVLYHVVPVRVPGGYVGVDVFFVVSGFLITSHLLREVERTGRVRLARFWARRARRLLPAALLVLLVSAVAALVWVPQTLWQQFLREIGASAVYVENWVLAGDAVDYLAHTNTASPAQHYWSLSTEEQFYLAWPLLIVASVWLAARVGAGRRAAVAAVFAVVTAGSFAWSLWATTAAPSTAYFATPARAWEFGLGGLLALLAGSPSAGLVRLRAVVSWAGFGAIAAAALLFAAQTPFPGTAALLPVLGTVAVIAAGAPAHDWSPTAVAGFGPVRLLGDVSYSAYLWHWPAVVVLPYALGHPMGTRSKVGVLVFTVAAAWMTKVWVEDPVRSGTPLARRGNGTTFLATAVASALVVGVAAGGWGYVQHRVDAARAAAQAFADGSDPCYGAGAMDPDRACAAPFAWRDTVDTTFAQSDLPSAMRCLQGRVETTPVPCRSGSDSPTETVALLGDSHAAALSDALGAVAEERDWAVLTFTKAGCPALGSDRFQGADQPADELPACAAWSRAALDRIAADPSITRVVTTYRSDIYKWTGRDGSLDDEVPADVVQGPLLALADAGKRITVVRAVPSTGGVLLGPEQRDLEYGAPECIAAAGPVDDPCAGPRDQRLVRDQLAEAAAALRDPRIRVVDLTDAFCEAERCHELVGGVVVYFDGSHLTATFSRSLGQLLDQRMAG